MRGYSRKGALSKHPWRSERPVTARTNQENNRPNNMSQQIKQSSMGLTFLVKGVPSSTSEFDEMAGEVGACLDYGIDDVLKHVWLSRFRPKFAELLAARTGIPRAKTGERVNKDGTTTAIYEKEVSYLQRVLDKTHKDVSEYNELAQEVADSLPFASAFTGTGTGRGRIGKEYLSLADEIIEQIESTGSDYSSFMDTITSSNAGFVFAVDESGTPTREAIATAVKVDLDRQRRESIRRFKVR